MDNLQGDEHCELAAPLEQLHKAMHLMLKLQQLDPEQQFAAHQLGHRIIALLNEEPVAANTVKLWALYEVLVTGAQHLRDEIKRMEQLQYLSQTVQ